MSQEAVNESEAVRAMAAIPVTPMKLKRRTQREILLEVLRTAGEYKLWVSLAELAEKTRFPQASISAQLRHLRKKKYGAWRVERRRREWVSEELVWEYRLGGEGGNGSK